VLGDVGRDRALETCACVVPPERVARRVEAVVEAVACERGDGAAVAVRSDLCKGPLAVRNRRPGDRFRPSGLRGQKKLQDFVAKNNQDFAKKLKEEQDKAKTAN